MASRNIFAATPPSSKRKTAEVLGKCARCDNAEVTRCSATFGGCENYNSSGCRYKISILSAAARCVTCLADVNPGVLCLGVPNLKGTKNTRGKTAYVNTHLRWEDCLGQKVKLGKEGKSAFKFIERVDQEDSRIGVPCARCTDEIVEGDFVISTYQPDAENPLPANNPLHAKGCARAVFDDNHEQFVDNMMLEGISSDKVVSADSIDFDF
ncbi:unnamed protein product [Ectocarpus sp. CCAP 1310/34]|nr:unnamed protein product [Ectocarpus sp. CCAP 1310/34]